MRTVLILAILALSACEDPSLGIGANINSGGVSVSPVLSGRVGGVGVAVSP
jgi:predicted small secreted protein